MITPLPSRLPCHTLGDSTRRRHGTRPDEAPPPLLTGEERHRENAENPMPSAHDLRQVMGAAQKSARSSRRITDSALGTPQANARYRVGREDREPMPPGCAPSGRHIACAATPSCCRRPLRAGGLHGGARKQRALPQAVVHQRRGGRSTRSPCICAYGALLRTDVKPSPLSGHNAVRENNVDILERVLPVAR